VQVTPQLLAKQQADFDILFEDIAQDIIDKGYSIRPKALPNNLTQTLHAHLNNMAEFKFSEASIGREQTQQVNETIRNDEIAWIHGNSIAGVDWLNWTAALQTYLNRRLLLGLFSFESHFAHYALGHYYKRHIDAFKGQANRVLSLVTYLNPEWQADDGGELVIYENADDHIGLKVLPEFGTIAVFLSEEFEHEVKPARKDRYSIAGWFRINTSTTEKVDPPL